MATWSWRSSSGCRRYYLDDDWDVMGQRATVSGTATFDRTPVIRSWLSRTSARFAVPQQLGAGRNSCMRRSRPESRAAPCATQMSSSGPGHAPSSKRPGQDGPTGLATTPTLFPVRPAGHPGARCRGSAPLGSRTLDEVDPASAGGEAAARGSVAVAEAKAFASEVAVGSPATCSRSVAPARPTSATTSPALAQRAHARQPRPGGLEIPPCR